MLFHSDLVRAITAAVIEVIMDVERQKLELRREMRQAEKEERRAAMKETWEEKKASLKSVLKVLFIIIGVAAAVVGIVLIIRRVLDAREELLYGESADEEYEDDEDPEIAGEFEAEA